MKWNTHKEYEGKHAFMGASNYHWLNYDENTFKLRYYSQFSQMIGTTIHELAHDCIMSRIKLSKHDSHLVDMALYKAYIPKDAYDANQILATLMPFVNDALGFHMSSEILLYYNPYCFGTTDAIAYNDYEKTLRIHDLKTGVSPVKMEQLYIYAALFCLEYKVDPIKLKMIECRIYQNTGTDEGCRVLIDQPSPDIIVNIMELITRNSNLIASYLEREGR